MGTAEHERVSADEFLEWVSGQAGRFELVEGYLVEVRTGATQGHNVVITNIVVRGTSSEDRQVPDDSPRLGGSDARKHRPLS